MDRKRGMMRSKTEYIERVTAGEGFMPWEAPEHTSEAETRFREDMERRKDALLAARMPVTHPVLLTEQALDRARRNASGAAWAEAWLQGHRDIADHVVGQPPDYVERMIPDLTPTNPYGLTCPACVDRESQEGMGYPQGVEWDYRSPDLVRCRACGQTYPDPAYPETGQLVCPRRDQTFTYVLNEAERRNPEDRSGARAWKWVGKPHHTSFTGFIRGKKIAFMISALRSLALAHRLTGAPRYAPKTAQILERLTICYRNWLYHDFYDTVADCDPLYAAWHHLSLKLEWKRHACGMAFGGVTYETGPVDDTLEQARMLATYFGSGRVHPSTDAIDASLGSICLAYDLIYESLTPEARARIEKGLILEYLLTAEPFVGGTGGPPSLDNKSPFVYQSQALVAKCLGLPGYADAALRGYEALQDRSFLSDGFSKESPAYTTMFVHSTIWIPETLHGFSWPEGFPGRSGQVDVFGSDPQLRRILRTTLEQLRPDGRHLPLSDTMESGAPSPHIFEIGLNRYPDLFAGTLPRLYRGRKPTDYAALHLDARELARDDGLDLPETLFPAWMTAVLRHGQGPDASVLALPFNPPGGHRQPDNLSLYYADRGQTLLGDLGYVGDSPMNRWIRATSHSHNLVIVDGQDQLFRSGPGTREPGLRRMATSPRISVVEAASRAYLQCRDYRRLVALVKGPGAQTFVVDLFRVKGGSAHTYRLFSEIASSDAPDGALEIPDLGLLDDRPLPDFGSSVDPDHIFGLRDIRRSENPPPSWQAIWRQAGRRYRLHALSPAHAVEISNGPGQETPFQIGRRVRYLDAIRTGQDLDSAFVAIHEPDGPNGAFPISAAERLDVPPEAGPDAVALRITSTWGTYLFLSEFEREAEIAGVRFEGTFGVFCRTPEGGQWMVTVGARALKTVNGFGFEGAPASWSGGVVSHTEHELVTDCDRPSGWPETPEGVRAYVLVGPEKTATGYPVQSTDRRRIRVDDFPLQPAERFTLPAVQWQETR